MFNNNVDVLCFFVMFSYDRSLLYDTSHVNIFHVSFVRVTGCSAAFEKDFPSFKEIRLELKFLIEMSYSRLLDGWKAAQPLETLMYFVQTLKYVESYLSDLSNIIFY